MELFTNKKQESKKESKNEYSFCNHKVFLFMLKCNLRPESKDRHNRDSRGTRPNEPEQHHRYSSQGWGMYWAHKWTSPYEHLQNMNTDIVPDLLVFFPKPLLNMGMSLPQMRTIASDYFAPPPMRCSPPWLKLLTVSLHQRTEVRQDLDSVNGFTGDLWDPWWYCHVLGACMHNRLVVLYCTN